MPEVASRAHLEAMIPALDAALTEAEIAELFTIIRQLRAEGVGIVYISHRLEELIRIGDYITVLRDGAVVGGGPAGLTAALYLARFRRSCLVVDAGSSRAAWIPRSRNYPGFPPGISGNDLLARLREQAAGYGARLEHGQVEHIEPHVEGFSVRYGERSCITRRARSARQEMTTAPTPTASRTVTAVHMRGSYGVVSNRA